VRNKRPRPPIALALGDETTLLHFIGGRSHVNAMRRLRADLRVAALLRLPDPLHTPVRVLGGLLGCHYSTAWRTRERLYAVMAEGAGRRGRD
jgi:hypothetical protein